jgi:hypothetical protein
MKNAEAHKPERRRYFISKTEVYESQLWSDQNDRKGEGKKAGRKKGRGKKLVRPHIQGLIYNSSFVIQEEQIIQCWMTDSGCW